MVVTARVLNPPTLRYGGEVQPTIVSHLTSSVHLPNMLVPLETCERSMEHVGVAQFLLFVI